MIVNFIKKLKILSVLVFGGMVLLSASSTSAIDVFGDQICNGNTKDSTVCKTDSKTTAKSNPLFGPEGVLTIAINLVSMVVAVVAIIMMFIAGIRYMTSGDNPQEVGKARTAIIYAIVGLVIALVAQAIVQFFLKGIS